MNLLRPVFSLLFLLLLCGCKDKTQRLQNTIADYYKTYQERSDFDKFLEFYADDMILEDMISGERKVGKKNFADFFNWNAPGFEKLSDKALIITDQLIQGNKVVTQGHFTSFKWGQTTFEAMQFTSILTFNSDLKIVKHIDWINYPKTLIDYNSRQNSNEWISDK